MHKHKTHYFFIGFALVVIVLAILLISGVFTISKPVSITDIQLSNFQYELYSVSGVPILYDENGNLEAEFSLIISTNRDDLYYRVYDAKREVEINKNPDDARFSSYAKKLNMGDNKFNGFRGLYLRSLGDSPQLEVCISTSRDFTKFSKNIVCSIRTFSPPHFQIEITPDPLVFTVSKEEWLWDLPHKTITIKNIGNIVAPSNVFIPSYHVTDPAYQTPLYYPSHPSMTTTFYSALQPGESYEYDVGVTIGNGGEFDTPLGTYEVKGYIYGISPGIDDCRWCVSVTTALFKKEFTIKTIVNP